MNSTLKRIESLIDLVEDLSRLPDTPMVSVCMTTFNHECYIRQALDSILMQKVPFLYEIVIGEDKSTDATRELVIEYQRKHPDKIRLRLARENLYSQGFKPGFGVRAACRGKYIALLEGDDYWTDPLKLQKQVEFLESNPEYVMCFHNTKEIDDEGVVLRELKLTASKQKDWTGEELAMGRLIPTLTICYRNIPALREPAPEQLEALSGDIFLTVRLGEYGAAKYLGECIAPDCYRVHSGGLWSGKSNEEQTYAGMLTRLLIFKYKCRTFGAKHALDFLFHSTHGWLAERYPSRDPLPPVKAEVCRKNEQLRQKSEELRQKNEELRQKNEELRQKNEAIQNAMAFIDLLKNSRSYRIGCAVLWLPKQMLAMAARLMPHRRWLKHQAMKNKDGN